MTATKEEKESELLLPKSNNGDKPRYSILRARISAAFIPVFAVSVSGTRESLVTQYIVKRLEDEIGFSNVTKVSSCIDSGNSSNTESGNDPQSQASEQLTYYVLAQTIPAFFACLLLGSYADYVGRRLLLLVPVFTNFVKTAIICCIVKFNFDLSYFYLAYGIDGLAGTSYSILLALYSFTADISYSKKDRTFWIYAVSCASSTMSAVINVTGGYLIKNYGFFEAAIFLCGLTLLSFIVPLIFLPETLQQRRSIKGVSPLTHIKNIFGLYFLDGTVRRRATFCVCLLMFIVGVANDLHLNSLDSLYQMHYPFCWDSVKIGNYSAIRTAGGHFLAIIVYKLLQMCMAIEPIGMIGATFQGGAFVLEAFINASWQFYLVPVILIPSCLTSSVMRTMFSILAGPDHQGAVFSSIAVFETLCSLATSQIYNRIYSATVSFMPGAVYLVMASVSCVTVALFGVYFLVREKPQHVKIIVVDTLADKENIQKTNSFLSKSVS
ncbi:unnamed protein product [Candidula unifasciata]|uniref:Proton-coupled folate transporter n=1 Tax=Candidula unifasciata TaxID=100452 RepID=A0A8S3ZM25_9EUPU|nr:unnamed protein product [Candidula unifasciata]